MASSDKVTVKSKELFANAFRILEYMRKEEKMCDLTIIARGVKIFAHKIVLVSRCQYFYNYFSMESNLNQGIIEFDFDPELLTIAIDYMYTNQLTIPLICLEEFMELLETLLLNDLAKECLDVLPGVTNNNNCLLLKRLLQKNGQYEHTVKILEFIDDNIEIVVTSQDFIRLSFKEIHEVVSRENLRFRKKDLVYEAVMKWVDFDPSTRKTHLKSLIKFMRLSHLPKNYLEIKVLANKHIKTDIHCKSAVMEHFAVNDDIEKSANCVTKSCTEKILVIIGGKTEAPTNILKYYDFKTGNWSQTIQIPFKISYPALIGVDDKVYLFGNEKSDNLVRTYDPLLNIWNEVGHMKKPISLPIVAGLDGYVYIFEMLNDKYDPEKYDVKTNLSANIAKIPFIGRIDGVGVINKKIYAVSRYLLGCYDTQTDEWTKTSITEDNRLWAVVCALNGKLYIAGGWNQLFHTLNTVRVYDPEKDIWTYAKPMKVARLAAQAVVVDDKMYVVGGRNQSNSVLNSIEVYDEDTDSWTLLPEMNGVDDIHKVAIINIVK